MLTQICILLHHKYVKFIVLLLLHSNGPHNLYIELGKKAGYQLLMKLKCNRLQMHWPDRYANMAHAQQEKPLRYLTLI